jgi:exosome complex exonuclease RRP6
MRVGGKYLVQMGIAGSSDGLCLYSYILSNNYLFQLAERPPADMAAFLAAFNSIPPVIRSRAKELLDVIQDTTREYHDSFKIAEADESNIESTPVSVQDTPMVEVKAMAATSTDTLNSRLWAKGSCSLQEPSKIEL